MTKCKVWSVLLLLLFFTILCTFDQFGTVVHADEQDPNTELSWHLALERLERITEMLAKKFVRKGERKQEKVNTPEEVLKHHKHSRSDYDLLRLIASFSGYKFDDELEETANSEERKKVNEARKKANEKGVKEFVRNMCATFRAFVWTRKYRVFDDKNLIQTLANMKKFKELVNAKNPGMPTDWAEKQPKTFTGESNWRLTYMPTHNLEPKHMQKHAPTAMSYANAYERMKEITGFLVHAVEKDKLLEEPEKDVEEVIKNWFKNDEILSKGTKKIFQLFATETGYVKQLEKMKGQGMMNRLIGSAKRLVGKDSADLKKLKGKMFNILTEMYVLVSHSFINGDQKLKVYVPVYENMANLEEHYKLSTAEVKNAEKELNKKANEIESRGGGEHSYGWMYASDHFVLTGLGGATKSKWRPPKQLADDGETVLSE